MSNFYLNKTVYNKQSNPLSYIFEWKKDTKNILMTVALPLKNMENISWLSLESLRRQEEVPCDWELIIFDDNANSRKVLDSFVGKLPRCKRIFYKSIFPQTDGRKSGKFKGTVPLIDKWVGIALDSSPSSIGYILQAGDDYSPKKMIKNHFYNFQNSECIFSTYPRGVFYHLGLKKKVFYDGYNIDNIKENFLTTLHLNKAVRTADIRKVRPSFSSKERNKLIDKYVRTSIYDIRKINPLNKKYIYNVDDIDPEDWKTGFYTDGLNIISNRNYIYSNSSLMKKTKVWVPDSRLARKRLNYQNNFNLLFPKNVFNFLNSLNIGSEI